MPSSNRRSSPSSPDRSPADVWVVYRCHCGRGEILVFKTHHRPLAHGQVATPGQALGVEASGPIERFGHRGSPVDDQWFEVRTRDRQPADMKGLAVGVRVVRHGVDTAKAQGLVTDLELSQPSQAGPHHDVSLGTGLEGSAPSQVKDRIEHFGGVSPHGVERTDGHDRGSSAHLEDRDALPPRLFSSPDFASFENSRVYSCGPAL